MTITKISLGMELPPEKEEAVQQIRELTLEHGEHNDATLYRFEKDYYVHFVPGPSLLGRKVYVYTNYVVTDDSEDKGEQAEFVRNQYNVLEWRRDSEEGPEGEGGAARGEGLGTGVLLTDTDVYCELKVTRAGSFHYYFVYDNPESRVGPQGSGWFAVNPTLTVGGSILSLDGIMCQTVLAKCLGPISRWERVLQVAHQAGYNMIHFTPVQELGASDSSYSISNQLKLNPRFNDPVTGREATFADVENLVSKMQNEWKMLAICDVVLNHTANETPWLATHPEATYNARDCAHLRPAALLDALLAALGARVAAGRVAGVPPRVHTHEHIEAVRRVIETEVIPSARLEDMFTCDVDRLVQRFEQLARNKVPGTGSTGQLQLQADPQRRRRAATIDMDLALALFNIHRPDCPDEEERVRRCGAALRESLERLNDDAAAELSDAMRQAVDNCVAGMRYERLQSDGPRIEEVSAKRPLVPRYFTAPAHCSPDASVEELEAVIYGDDGRFVMAHNGWVMGADPLQDFAARERDGRVYLRRELIAWGDSVKLRYGAIPEDSPFLWALMRQYVEQTASLFHGLRLDNCHSTPLHVAEYMLDCARSVRPDLYVVAELFTNSDTVDNIFVNRLGITSLIREAQSAWDAHEQGRLVHRFGGRAAGAFPRPPRRAARPRVAHALLLDLTHDNPSPVQRRSLFDLLPSAALVAMAACATGSTRGLDDLVPHHIHVVEEQRLYPGWAEEGVEGESEVIRADSGLLAARRELNKLHHQLAAEGYCEVFVDQMDPDVVAVTRHHPVTRKSVILVARTAFSAPAPDCGGRELRPLRFEGQLTDIALEACLRHKDYKMTGRPFEPPGTHAHHPKFINGLAEYEVALRTCVPLDQSQVFAAARRDGDVTELAFRPLPPGAVVALRVSPLAPHAAALAALAPLARPAPDPLQLAPLLEDLDLADFNVLLYCCDAEERERAGGVYDVPGHGPFVYAGLQGVMSVLDTISETDDLAHPLCANLRAGDWLLEYQWQRLESSPRLAAVAARYRSALRPVTELPRFLVPAYCVAVLRAMHAAVQGAALSRLGGAALGSRFARELALTSVQLVGAVPSASLPAAGAGAAARGSLSAGLPHFATGYMRCWGRDTFVALRGLLLLAGRGAEARAHILAFAACLRHGLIPNLLDGGRNARYNCRDAVWWWLESIQQYCSSVPGGNAILSEPVTRLFPSGDGPAQMPLHDVIQEALDTHFQGLVFRERNAGRQIDAHMSDKGFNVQIGVDPDTGFPFGGNEANCGTWMDKMGSSDAAGIRGRPATPRDGSAVELVALAYSAAAWLAREHRAARYPYPGVARRHRDGTLSAWTWPQWADRIRRAFERHFWVPPAPSALDARPDLVHRRGIYKDSHGASQPWADYQLRCNFPVAMVIAPDLFDPKHAWLALDNVERLLLGPLGVKTLDPADWAYRGDYDNSNDSTDPSVAHGFNYHQGPEWVWPVGFYLRARLIFAHANGRQARTLAATYAALAPHAAELRASPWRGLPELTNAGGAYCRDSCRSQAWSSACVLEALHAAESVRRARPLTPD